MEREAPAVVTYQRELASVDTLWEEAEPLFRMHWREIAHYEDIALAPDKAAYRAAQVLGTLQIYTARGRAGELAGYLCFFVRLNPHYCQSLQAVQDVLFLHPAHRRLSIGVGLIQYAEADLRAQGVQVVYHHVKRTNRVGRLLERLGYELVDEVYAKRLDERRQ